MSYSSSNLLLSLILAKLTIMPDNSGYSQPGSLVSPASRGAAFLLDSNLSQRPLNILMHADQLREAKRAAALKAKQEEDDKKYKEFYDLTKDPNTKTFQPWQHEVDDDAQKFLSNAVSPYSRGTQQHAQYMGDIAKQKQLLESKAFKGLENGKIVTDAAKEVAADPEYNENAKAAVFNAVKDKKIDDFQPSDITSALNNPANYNVAKIVDNQVKSFDTQVKELERRAGPDFKTQAISANIPLQFDEKGNPVIDKYTGRYAIAPNDAWVRTLDDNPKIKNILDSQIAQQAQLSDQALRGEIPPFQPKTRLQLAAELFQGQGTVKVEDKLSPIPVHQPREDKTPIVANSIGGTDNRMTVTLRHPTSGKVSTYNAYEYASTAVADDKGKQFTGEVKTPYYIELNKSNGAGQVKNNTDNLKVTYQGLTYGLTNPQTGNRVFAPESVQNGEQFKQWIVQKVKDPAYKNYTEYSPFIRATTIDDSHTADDYSGESTSGSKPTTPEEKMAALMGKNKQAANPITKGKKDILIPYKGQVVLDATVQTKGAIAPNEQMQSQAQEINGLIQQARGGQPSQLNGTYTVRQTNALSAFQKQFNRPPTEAEMQKILTKFK